MLQKGIFATKFLGLQFLNLTVLIFISYWSEPSRILVHPHLFRVATPLVYLVYPLAYFFQEFMLFPNRKFRWYHALHFLPFAMTLLMLIPFYAESAEDKSLVIQSTLQKVNPNDLSAFPFLMKYHYYLRLVQFFVYTFWMILRFNAFIRKHSLKLFRKGNLLINWLGGDLIFKSVSNLLILFFFIFPPGENLQFHWSDIIKILDYIFVLSFLIYNPKLLDADVMRNLFALFHKEPNQIDHSQEFKDLFLKIESWMAEKQPFLSEHFTVKDLEQDLRVSSRKISSAIKDQAHLSFSDYINGCRLKYIEEQFRISAVWRKYTLEAIAMESGFGSRSNFYQAFKKLKQASSSPKVYFKDLEKKLSVKG